MEEWTCPDCGVREGQLHKLGCQFEKCPFCGWQLISCGCEYAQLGYDYRGHGSKHPTNGLPKSVYKHGLTNRNWDKWIGILEKKGRVPYILYPNVCARCGALFPDLFMVPDSEWEHYIELDKRDEVICRPCYDRIKSVIDKEQHG